MSELVHTSTPTMYKVLLYCAAHTIDCLKSSMLTGGAHAMRSSTRTIVLLFVSVLFRNVREDSCRIPLAQKKVCRSVQTRDK